MLFVRGKRYRAHVACGHACLWGTSSTTDADPLSKKLLDELYERVRILKACPWVESSDLEEFSIALDAPIYPPRPNLLAFSPASDFHSGHAGLSFAFAWKSAFSA